MAQPEPQTIEEKLAFRRPAESQEGWKSACCPHSEKDHCVGGQKHHNYRIRAGEKPTMTFTCETRHCSAVLCCCTAFQGLA